MATAEALVFDAIRTPRGKGKSNGALHPTKPVDLVVGLMLKILSRNVSLDPSRVDDVVLGCVSPVGDQGADIAKTAALKAGLPDTVSGAQLNRSAPQASKPSTSPPKGRLWLGGPRLRRRRRVHEPRAAGCRRRRLDERPRDQRRHA